MVERGLPVAATHDAGELTCAALIQSARGALAPLSTGEVLALISRDSSARLDLPAWCRMTGHDYLGSDEYEDHAIHYLRKRGNRDGEDPGLRQQRQ